MKKDLYTEAPTPGTFWILQSLQKCQNYPKLWGLFWPPLRHRWVFLKHGRNTVRTWTTLKGNHASQRLDVHLKYIKQHFSELNKTIQNPSSNTRLHKPSETAQTSSSPWTFCERFLPTAKIHKFPPIAQFGLGSLDLFRSKASSIISRACRGAPRWHNGNNPPTWWNAPKTARNNRVGVIHQGKKNG